MKTTEPILRTYVRDNITIHVTSNKCQYNKVKGWGVSWDSVQSPKRAYASFTTSWPRVKQLCKTYADRNPGVEERFIAGFI